jgi:hypothetical protein
MKKANLCHLLSTCGVVLLVAACSNDVELPTNYHDSHLAQPGPVQSSLVDDTINVAWQMATLENVTGLVLSFTDTTGAETTRFVDDETTTSYTEDSLSLESGATWVIRMWAVDDLGFFGPRSVADTLMVP